MWLSKNTRRRSSEHVTSGTLPGDHGARNTPRCVTTRRPVCSDGLLSDQTEMASSQAAKTVRELMATDAAGQGSCATHTGCTVGSRTSQRKTHDGPLPPLTTVERMLSVTAIDTMLILLSCKDDKTLHSAAEDEVEEEYEDMENDEDDEDDEDEDVVDEDGDGPLLGGLDVAPLTGAAGFPSLLSAPGSSCRSEASRMHKLPFAVALARYTMLLRVIASADVALRDASIFSATRTREWPWRSTRQTSSRGFSSQAPFVVTTSVASCASMESSPPGWHGMRTMHASTAPLAAVTSQTTMYELVVAAKRSPPLMHTL